MTPQTKAWLQVHCCVMLWGFTAVLGRSITMPAVPLVFWRMFLVAVALLLTVRVRRALWILPGRAWAAFAGASVLLSLHWLTLYHAIKVSNASVAITCIALAPVFLSVIEPFVARRPFDLLASACTLLPFLMVSFAMRVLSAFGATLVVNLEPVYTILLAMLLFGEQRELDLRFYAGVAIILGATFTYPLISRRRAAAAV